MPVIWTTISFAAGLIAADSLSWNNLVWILVGLIFSLFSGITLWFTKKRISDLPSLSWGLILAVILAFFLGGIRYSLSYLSTRLSGPSLYFELCWAVSSCPNYRGCSGLSRSKRPDRQPSDQG